jgi:AcrR family transcriptional regulator
MDADAKRKRKLEVDKQIEKRKENIINAALQVFLKAGIENSKISDIAKIAEVGEATIYRYFGNKVNLTIACATHLWNIHMSHMASILNVENKKNVKGFDIIKKILEQFGSMMLKQPELLRILDEFENYIIKEKISIERLIKFQEGVTSIESMVEKIIQKGIEDKSIRSDVNGMLFYMTATHSIMALAQKLVFRSDLLITNHLFDKQKQLDTLIDMELYYIKGKYA